MSQLDVSGPTASPTMRAWRVTTAARAFVVALVVGQAISNASLEALATKVFALVVLAVALCAVELDSSPGIARWTPVAEGVLAATILGTADSSASALLGYLALPPVIAGLRHGWVSTLNTALTTGVLLTAGYLAIAGVGSTAPQLQAALPWLFAGVGTGLLAAWLTRSVRAIEATQAPYSAAHRLLSQLRDLARRRPVELDAGSVAEKLLREVRNTTGATRAVLCSIRASSGVQVIAETGTPLDSGEETELAARSMGSRHQERGNRTMALPVRIGEQVYGAVVVHDPVEQTDFNPVQSMIDEHALRLDTALVFEEVRAMATAEERTRLAREIHDGVAQEVASLGYFVDDLASSATEPETRRAAEELRGEITRVVSELRLSIFDLRHVVGEPGGLTGALSDYVGEVSRHSHLRVHLSLDADRTWQLPPKVSTELLRVAQEAIANARKHAQAMNLWVTLTSVDGAILLEIADDGLGGAAPHAGHYGLSTMRERAHTIQAVFDVSPRRGGGTVVSIRVPTHHAAPHEGVADDHRAARR